MFAKPTRAVSRVFLHCSASSNRAYTGKRLREEIEAWHRERGFAQIGYHFVVDHLGEVIAGRSLEKTPAAQQGHNTGTIAICAHGLRKEDFTPAQLYALANLCHDINDAYGGAVTFHGHREVAAKDCPVFDYKTLLDLDAAGHITGRRPVLGV
jgi:N-acetylmuramoyl-L-alanine amidase